MIGSLKKLQITLTCVPNRYNVSLLADKMSPTLRPLADKITALLLKYPGCRVAQFAFADIFLREYGRVLKPKDWGCTGMNALIRALGEVVEVRQSSWLLLLLLFSFAKDIDCFFTVSTSRFKF